MTCRLILFTRYPIPGVTKTRLIPALGPEGAADLSRQMTEHVLERLRPLAGKGVEVQVWHDGGQPEEMSAWLGGDLAFRVQGGGDLGERMERAFRQSFAEGVERVVIAGSDCPGLAAEDVLEAMGLLSDNPVVLGPASDGGYYLIGIRRDAPPALYGAAFRGIPWGTASVYSATVNAMADAVIDVGLIDEKADVDAPEDLGHWEKESSPKSGVRGAKEMKGLRISVIVPTLNEAERIGALLEGLKDEGVEVVAADGGSTDGTPALCEAAGAKVVASPPGRARQMNAGAAAASGHVLLFLHADTRLPRGFPEMVRLALADPAVAGGAFSLSFDLDAPVMNLVASAATWRSWRLGIVFGDQALFCRSSAFLSLGGFPDLPVMEDAQFVRRLKKIGRFEVLDDCVVTSARRWERGGIIRTTMVNQLVTWLWVAGVGPERLAKLSRKLRKQAKEPGSRSREPGGSAPG